MKIVNFVAAGLMASAGAFAAKPVRVVTNASILAGNNVFSADTVYHLSGRVWVESGEKLTIQPGTVIKGLPGDTTNASVLVVTHNGLIDAQGTKEKPIVFTSVFDNEEDPTDLGPYDRALWGGVILLGDAPISEGTSFVEGIPSEARAVYGGFDPADSSGIMTYVSIRHGGKVIGAANEINGLTLGGVGNRTVLHHIEVFANNDDGFEWFGGTVNAKYLVTSFGNDDGFDYDFGFRGKIQYGVCIYDDANQDPNGNQCIEGDGFKFPMGAFTDSTLYSKPTFSNLTLIGSGLNGNSTAQDLAFRMREGSGGNFLNMIVKDWKDYAGRIENNTAGIYNDAFANLNRDSLNIEGSVFHNFGKGNTFPAILVGGLGADSLAAKNVIQDPLLRGIGWTTGSLDLRPRFNSPAFSVTHVTPADPFFDAVSYAGAFDSTNNWTDGWTALSEMNINKKYLRVQPMGGTKFKPNVLLRTANWDFVIHQDIPGVLNVAASKIFLDGNDVSAALGPVLANPIVLANGNRAYKAAGQSAAVFGAAGNHNVRVRLQFTNGAVLEDTFYYTSI